MPHRRMAPRDVRGSFELPHEDLAEVMTYPETQPTLTETVPNRLLAPHPEAEEDYANWVEHYPDAIQYFSIIEQKLKHKRVAVFLDYDGTLTPIVENPDNAMISEEMRSTVHETSELYPTAIISGREVEKVQNFVRLETLHYAGSHGLDIRSPTQSGHVSSIQPAAAWKPLINKVYEKLHQAVRHINGANVEHNSFCVSVHFRNCREESWEQIREIVEGVVAPQAQLLRSMPCRKVLIVRPNIDWDKGKAVEHFLKSWCLDGDDVIPIYLGDDRTDEDAFCFLRNRRGSGIGILVSSKIKPSKAHFSLRDPMAVLHFLRKLSACEHSPWHQESTSISYAQFFMHVRSLKSLARDYGSGNVNRARTGNEVFKKAGLQ